MKKDNNIIIDVEPIKKEEHNISDSTSYNKDNGQNKTNNFYKSKIFSFYNGKFNSSKEFGLLGYIFQIILIAFVGIGFFLVLIFTVLFSLFTNILISILRLFTKKQ